LSPSTSSIPITEGETIVLNPRKHLALMDPAKLPLQPPSKVLTKEDEVKLAAMKAETDLERQQALAANGPGSKPAGGGDTLKKKKRVVEQGGPGSLGEGSQ
jgi:hypothetical protein